MKEPSCHSRFSVLRSSFVIPIGILTVLAFALAVTSRGAQPDDPPRFVIDTIDGTLPAAPVKLDAGWSLHPAGAKEPLAAPDWVALRRAGAALPAPPARGFVLLTSGDRLPIDPAAPVAVKDGRVVFRPAGPLRAAGDGTLSVFQPYVALVVFAVPEGVDRPEQFVHRLRHAERSDDVVLLRSGDRIEGQVAGLDEAECAVTAGQRKVTTPVEKLAGIALATRNLARPRLKKTYGHAVLAGGTRVHFTDLRIDAKTCRGRTPFGANLEFSPRDLLALDLYQGRAVYLSDLTPARVETTPYLGVAFPPGLDAAPGGDPLRLAGAVFDKGLSLCAGTRVTYRLDGRYRWFETLVGLDDAAGPRGRVRPSVVIDGKPRPLDAEHPRTAGTPPTPLRLDVRGARELTLAVDFAGFGDVQARTTWAGARLIKDRE
jgi:hypothetical protein